LRGHKILDTSDEQLLIARKVSSGNTRKADVATAAYHLAAAKLRTWGVEQHAKDLESAVEQAEGWLASEWTERDPMPLTKRANVARFITSAYAPTTLCSSPDDPAPHR
jgi:hypothetical protein